MDQRTRVKLEATHRDVFQVIAG